MQGINRESSHYLGIIANSDLLYPAETLSSRTEFPTRINWEFFGGTGKNIAGTGNPLDRGSLEA